MHRKKEMAERHLIMETKRQLKVRSNFRNTMSGLEQCLGSSSLLEIQAMGTHLFYIADAYRDRTVAMDILLKGSEDSRICV